ncbi:tetratricopeptide repeat protein [Actinoplanes sp. CA-030573]|uniref:NACHT and WD repeat domain-containing protein n=1 Tax=Actinoplanes sp. CA-030573 TaxID=3239898 RepID=UPI003D912EC9
MADFTGREWLFERLAEWERSDRPVLLIEGPPGSGKTAIADRIAHGYAYAHFCRSRQPSTLSPLTFVERLSEALANGDEDVRRALLEAHAVTVDAVGAVEVEEAHPGAEISGVRVTVQLHNFPATLAYEELVRKPLERAGVDAPTVLVDALDEGGELGRDSIAELLANVAGDPAAGGVRFVLTARSADARIDDRFRSAERIHLVRDAPPGDHDIRDYLAARLASMPRREREIAVDRVAAASDGIFLYARHVADTLLRDRDVWSRIESFTLPRSLSEVYATFLTRELARDQSDRDWRERFRPILGLLAVARGDGFTREALIAASRRLSDARSAQLWDAVTACRPFLEVDAEDRVRIFHESFREFLLTDPPYPIFPSDARDALCDHFLSEHDPDWTSRDDAYAVEHLPRHLLDAERPDDVTGLLEDMAFLAAKISAFGVPALLRDLAAAVRESTGDERMRQLYDVVDRSAHRLRTPAGGDYPGRVSQHLLLAVREPARAWIGELAERHLAAIGRPYLRSRWHAGTESPALLRTLVGHAGAVVAVTVDGRGERALSASSDGTARLWDIETGEPLGVFGAHRAGLVAAAFVREESAILTASTDGELRVWDLRTGDPIAGQEVPGGIAVVDVTADGTSCAAGGPDGAVFTWDLDGAIRELLPACPSAVTLLRHNDEVVVAGTAAGEVHVWDAGGGAHRGVLTGHGDRVTGLRLLGPRLAVSTSHDGKVLFWSLESFIALRQVRSEGVTQCYDLAWVPGAEVVMVAGNGWTVDTYDVRTGDEVARISSDKLLPHLLTMSPDAATVLATSVEDRRIRVIDVASREVTGELSGHGDYVDAVCITPDSRRAVSAGHDRTVRVWDLTAAAGEGFEGHGASVLAVSTAAHRNLLLSSSFDDTVRGWDLETGEPRLFFSRIQQFINVIAADVYENFALVGNARGHIERFPTGEYAQVDALDYSLRRVTHTLAEGSESVSSIVSLGDLMVLVIASWHDTDILVRDLLGTNRLIHTLTGHTGKVWALTALPGGRVASGAEDGTIRVWDVIAGTESFVLRGDDAQVRALVADPEGRFLLAGCDDGSLRLWDVAGRRELRRIRAHDGEVRSVAWPATGIAYSTAVDGHLIEWELPDGARTIDIDMGAAMNQVAIADGGIYFGTSAGDMHGLTRVPALVVEKGFRSDIRLTLMTPEALLYGEPGSFRRLEVMAGQIDFTMGAPLTGGRVDGRLALLSPASAELLDIRTRRARWKGETGDPVGAAEAMEGVLRDLVRTCGPDDSRVLAARGELARWRGEAGDAEAAARAAEELVADATRIMGPDHQYTLSARGNLATRLAEAGNAAGAVQELERLLAARMRLLGPDHPDTLLTRNNLLHVRTQTGDTTGVLAAFEELLADRLRVLGPDHPHTLDTYAHIAAWRGQAGDPAGAVAVLKELLPALIRVYGPADPHTLEAQYNLAVWRGESGDPAGAVLELEHLLRIIAQVFGPEHQRNLPVYAGLAHWRARAGNYAGYSDALERRLAIAERVQGADHPDTVRNREALVRFRNQSSPAPGE